MLHVIILYLEFVSSISKVSLILYILIRTRLTILTPIENQFIVSYFTFCVFKRMTVNE